MAKKIRFPLEMNNGVKVRTLEELLQNFSLDRIIFYLLNGKILVWLRDRESEEKLRAAVMLTEAMSPCVLWIDELEKAFANEKISIKTKDIVEEIKNTNSLSEIMKESLEHMAKEYETKKFKNAAK